MRGREKGKQTHTFLVGLKNGTAAMENSLAVPQKVKYRGVI